MRVARAEPPWSTDDLPRTPVARTNTQPVQIRGFLMAADLENIIELMGPQEVIGRAINLLMRHHDVSRDAAFEMLVHRSCGSRRSVRDISAEIVQRRELESA